MSYKKRVKDRLSANLKRLRKEKGLTQRQAAELLGLKSWQQYQAYELGKANISIVSLIYLAELWVNGDLNEFLK